ncbi:putative heat-shock related protein [Flavobacterium limnosediminis JC2902]|uniref:Putative heat-shock related protein n=1 Tax=Flavobacterium limnosediminis JC2902 TaxID=1341181 RepID=V6SP75_9FLAO|nr:Hsp20/alpha crystallin family protein [Flavobacterium limnosediminis]ESU28234.1 putative heat-shock related protein [Flavobacterium limnosediminis JC2902]
MGLLAKNDSKTNPYTLLEEFFPKDIVEWGFKNFTDIGSTMPSVNLSETEREYQIDLAAPGMKKEDFRVEIEDKTISIASEKQERFEETNKKENYTRKEFNYTSFCRSFHLPDAAETERIEAIYKDGILHVTIPKNTNRNSNSKKNIPIH